VDISLVPRAIALQLRQPEIEARLRQTREATLRIGMPMEETPVNEDHGFATAEHKIGPAGELSAL
jgi:hypothetical protein